MLSLVHQDASTLREILLAFRAHEPSMTRRASHEEYMFGFTRFFYAGRLGTTSGHGREEARRKKASAMLACITLCNLAMMTDADEALREASRHFKHDVRPYDVQGNITFLGTLAGIFHAERLGLERISLPRLRRVLEKECVPRPSLITGF